jgi:hypothetical protein
MPKIYFLGPEEVIHQLQLDVEQPANWLEYTKRSNTKKLSTEETKIKYTQRIEN